MKVTKKNKKLFYGILISVIVLLIILGTYLVNQKQQFFYVFDKSKFCPDIGDCNDYRLESRKCDKIGDCIASCSYGCVSNEWMKDKIDCQAIWDNFECECIKGICQRK